ncbi:hypothetical protein G9A89_022550 [Geosiphon pyriformis]|nr:hypothetical protein G9A89_022550 [Geosiphon pyriformis]
MIAFDFLESLNFAVSKTGTLHGCHIWWKIFGCHCCYKCQGLNHLAVDCKVSPLLSSKFFSNSAGGFKVFKSSLVGAKSYAKTVFVVLPVASAANVKHVLGATPKAGLSLVPVVASVPDSVVESRLVSLESHLNKLSLLIKSIIEPVGFLVVLVTKLLSTPPVVNGSIEESLIGVKKQVKAMAAVIFMLQKDIGFLKKKCEQDSLEAASDDEDINNNNDNNKDFSVYNNIFDVIMHLWEDQPSSIKSNSN